MEDPLEDHKGHPNHHKNNQELWGKKEHPPFEFKEKSMEAETTNDHKFLMEGKSLL